MKVATPLNIACTDIADIKALRLPRRSPRPPQQSPPRARPKSVMFPIKILYDLMIFIQLIKFNQSLVSIVDFILKRPKFESLEFPEKKTNQFESPIILKLLEKYFS